MPLRYKFNPGRLSPAAAFIAAAAFLYYPVLKPGFVLYGNDTIFHDYIMLLFGWRALRDGTLVTWMPYIYGGIPFIGSFAFCPFYAPSWLFLILPFPFAFNIQYVLHSVLAGAFMYRFLRALRLKRFPATFGGLAFQVCGHFTTLCYPGHLQKVQAIVWIPLALAFLHRGLFTKKRANFLYAGGALSMPLLASHPQIYYYGAGTALLYLLWCFADRRRHPLSVPARRILPLFAIVIFFSLALSGAQVLPGYETAGYSVRGGGMAFKDATQGSYPPAELLELILPRFTGDSIRGGYGHYCGRWGERLVSDYVGMAVVILALIGWALSRRTVKFFLSILFLLAAIVACGVYSPGYHLMFNIVPGMNRFRSPATVMFLMSLSAVVLAAFGLEAILKRAARKDDWVTHRKFLKGFLILSVVFLFATLLIHNYYGRVYRKFLHYEATGGDVAYFYQRAHLIVNGLRRSIFFASVILGALAFLFYARSLLDARQIPPVVYGIVQAAILIIFAIDPCLNDRAFIQSESAAPYHEYILNTWPDTVLRKKPPPVRLLELGNELSNRHILSRIGVPLGYHPIELRNYIDAWNATGPGTLAAARLTACQYILSARGGKVDAQLIPIEENAQMHKMLYRWRAPTLYAYVPAQIKGVPDRKTLLKKMSAENFNPHETSFILTDGVFFRKRSHLADAYKIEVTRYDTNSVTLECDMPEDSFVVFGDVWMPGWRAMLKDGTRLAFLIANNAFRCLEVPKGKHTIKMYYRPASLIYGIIISIIALALWIGLVFYLHKTRDKKPDE